VNGTLAWASLDDVRKELVLDAGVPAATEALDFASYMLWGLSGKLYGPIRTVTEAYDTREALKGGSRPYPVLLNGSVYNTTGCGACSCSGCGVFHRTRLRGRPVRSILDVWVNGKRLSRDEYVLLDQSVLGLMSSAVCGATCMTVRYAYGTGVPPGGHRAAVRLAEELLKSATGADCALPERVTSVSRQGMSWTLLDPQDFMDKGRTGIYEIDLLLRALNPAGALARPRVFSPDLERATVYDYSPPPLSLLLEPGDQVVQHGHPARWALNEPRLVAAIGDPTAYGKVSTRLSDGTTPNGDWRSYGDDSGGAVLDLTPAEVGRLCDGMGYEVLVDGQQVASGTVRLLEGA
jgi:hypothetical protein